MKLVKLYSITFTEAQLHERVRVWRQLSVGKVRRVRRRRRGGSGCPSWSRHSTLSADTVQAGTQKKGKEGDSEAGEHQEPKLRSEIE